MVRAAVSATGAVSLDEVRTLDRAAAEARIHPGVMLLAGVGSSGKRLREPTSAGRSTPALKVLQQILEFHSIRVRPCIHYSPSDLGSVVDEIALLSKLVPEISDVVCLQLNGGLSISAVAAIRRLLPRPILVSQVPIYRMCEKELLNWARAAGPIDVNHWVLIDGSGGKGDRVHRMRVHDWRGRLAKQGWKGVGVAGGYGANDLPPLGEWHDAVTLADCTSGVFVDGAFSIEEALRWYNAASETLLRLA